MARTVVDYRVATGFPGATNLAVSGDGSAYVTELFGGKISKVNRQGKVTTFKELAEPAVVEVADDSSTRRPLAPTNPDTGQPVGNGTVVRFRAGTLTPASGRRSLLPSLRCQSVQRQGQQVGQVQHRIRLLRRASPVCHCRRQPGLTATR